VDRVQLSLQRKDHELQRLSALVEKYRPYYEQHNEAKLELADREGAFRALAKENQLLKKEFDQLLRESSEVAAQLRQAETEKQGLLRERHVFEVS
jgi:hypothetical protein